MAHIRANTKNGKIVSYRFTVCLGRDCNRKQIRKYTTWPIPPDTSTAEAKKAAERAADIWEQELIVIISVHALCPPIWPFRSLAVAPSM